MDILAVAMDYLMGKFVHLQKRCLIILGGAGSNVEEHECVLMTVVGFMDIEDALRSGNGSVERIW